LALRGAGAGRHDRFVSVVIRDYDPADEREWLRDRCALSLKMTM
jgi:hypothetical protein